jgi:tRNA/rRNA methyltransferase
MPDWRDRLRVVLVAPRNPLNIGAAARAISNFGFRHLRLVNPYEVAFREARSAVGASAVLAAAREYSTLAEAVADCTLVVGTTALGRRGLLHPLRRLEYGGRVIRKHLAESPAAILFGSEKFGLANDDMSHCHWLMRIPTREEHGSMNLGQSVAVSLYELIRDSRAPVTHPRPLRAATGEQTERLTALFRQALDESGYVNPLTSSSTEQKLRRMVRRQSLTGRDAVVWLGMFRQVLWKLRNK